MNKVLRILRKKFKYLLSLLSFVLLLFVFYKSYKLGILTDEEELYSFLGDWYFMAPIIFIALRIMVSFVLFLPNMIFILVGFAMFGSIRGGIYNYIASSLAAFANYFMVKIFGSKVLRKSFSEEKIRKYRKQINQSQKKFNRFLFVMNSIPFAPSNFFCMIAPLTSITNIQFIQIIISSKLPETIGIAIVLKYFSSLLESLL